MTDDMCPILTTYLITISFFNTKEKERSTKGKFNRMKNRLKKEKGRRIKRKN